MTHLLRSRPQPGLALTLLLVLHTATPTPSQAALHQRLTEAQAQRAHAQELLRGVNGRLAQALTSK